MQDVAVVVMSCSVGRPRLDVAAMLSATANHSTCLIRITCQQKLAYFACLQDKAFSPSSSSTSNRNLTVLTSG